MGNNQKNKNGFLSISKGLVFILLGVIIAFLILYIWRFHYGLSSDQLHWSQFGDFFNGVISPIFAAINICIFWYLTKVIDLNNDKRQNQNAEHEKNIILMQFRKTEVDRLDEALHYVIANNNKYDKLADRVFNAWAIASYFKLTKSAIFNIGDDSKIAKELDSLIVNLNELYDVLEPKPEAETTISKNERDEVINRTINNIVINKGSIISSLQEITLNTEQTCHLV